jgi:hypothetical protein
MENSRHCRVQPTHLAPTVVLDRSDAQKPFYSADASTGIASEIAVIGDHLGEEKPGNHEQCECSGNDEAHCIGNPISYTALHLRQASFLRKRTREAK